MKAESRYFGPFTKNRVRLGTGQRWQPRCLRIVREEIRITNREQINNSPSCPQKRVGSSRVDLQACKLEYSIVSPK